MGDLMGKALWKLVENAQRFPRRGGRVLCVHGPVSFHRARPCATKMAPAEGIANWTAGVLGLRSTVNDKCSHQHRRSVQAEALELSRKDSNIRYLRHLGNSDIAYNFIRPHRALRFGRETRTPAMQAGLVSQRLALRDIFTAGGLTRRIFVAVVHVSVTVQPTESDEAELSTRCSPSARRQAA